MNTKWSLSLLFLLSLIVSACSNNTANSTGTSPSPAIQPPVVSPEPSQTVQPTTSPTVEKPSPEPEKPTTSAKPTPVTEAKTAEVVVDGLNVRSAPDTTSQVRGTIPKGTQAKIIQQQGSWYYIVMGRVEGWVSGSYIKVLDGNPGSTVSNPKPVTEAKTAEVIVDGLNVRSAPDTTSQVRGTIPKGTQAKIIQQQGSWYYIVMGRVEGWVSGSYIKVLDGNPGSARS
ncbi:SH3 domain-containing protein [Leptolyngbya sp. NIES-2104]|uniref:SH3 domain-containing protein n=1 Tax=Leptolyngbya sp. NIES-2104 TaxID=1552121 RepID=UPI0006EC92A4|nr:SH3 domain-containing protein [Leptolyngbya sp. NIES-2104]GAP94578.1 N-acetylmuramoyl-L-alanine amidase [Leptolyngbya sp. NIES-2104]